MHVLTHQQEDCELAVSRTHTRGAHPSPFLPPVRLTSLFEFLPGEMWVRE